MELEKAYNPKKAEGKIYRLWLERGAFTPKKHEQYVSIVIPPPNLTGALHLGHSLNNSIQDFIIRFARLKGYSAVWVPGTDHAGIATQNVVEKHLAEKGLSRQQLGRKKFEEEVWKWKELYQERIRQQLQAMGFSCDWSRERFTLDEICSRAVNSAFIRLAKDGLIYRGKRIIHWCPRCLTALSDIEVNHKEIEGKLYYVKYPLKEGGSITVATTRPETILGDVAVAVHTEDERFLGLVGKNALLPVPGIFRELPIIADRAVEISFGSGALKITPSHDPVDFEIAMRHQLPELEAMDEEAKISPGFGEYSGKDRFAARELIVQALRKAGLMEHIEPYTHSIGHCSRCDTMVEPRLSAQWFLSMKPLAEKAKDAYRREKLPEFLPESWGEVYVSWLDNIRDWCISRQLWWGHRLPVWYCVPCNQKILQVHRTTEPYTVLHPLGEIPESEIDRLVFQDVPVYEIAKVPEKCSQCGSTNFIQETDVLDTWFSSALWPFSVFGWPEETEDFRRFYPTTVLVTGFDIIFFWVARMVMFGLFFTDKVPFRQVYIHGLIRDIQGRKMTKSLGNVIDPLDVVEQFGADTLRFAFAFALSKGQDIRLSEDKLDGARKFLNKLWNASRLLLSAVPEGWKLDVAHLPPPSHPVDQWLFSRWRKLMEKAEKAYEQYEYREVAESVYDFLWSEYCDWYLEAVKLRLYGDESQGRDVLTQALGALSYILLCLHPLIPFLTEAIWQEIPFVREGMLLEHPWNIPALNFPEAEKWFIQIKSACRTIRALKRDIDIPVTQRADIYIAQPLSDEEISLIEKLAWVKVKCPAVPSAMAIQERVNGWQIALLAPDAGLLKKKLEETAKEIREVQARKEKTERILQDQKFLSSAPGEIQEKYQHQSKTLQEQLEELMGKQQRLSTALASYFHQ